MNSDDYPRWGNTPPESCPKCGTERLFHRDGIVRFGCGAVYRAGAYEEGMGPLCDWWEKTAKCHGSRANYRGHIASKVR